MRLLTLSAITLISLASPAMSQDACEIQRRLQQIDLYDGEITCHIREQTEAAIRRFQERKGLHVDGIAGEDTLRVLFGEGDEERKAPAVVVERRRAMTDQETFARCGDDVVEQSAERLGKGRALTGAKKSWESKVYSTEGLGIRYGDWNNAADKSEECFPASAGARFTWNCTVKARPCKAGE